MNGRISTLEQGQLFAERYQLGKKLGEGGMGAVFAAIDTRLGSKAVVIKVLHEDYNEREDLVQRLMNEAQAAAEIAHENIVDVTDRGQDKATGLHFVCYEQLQGCELLELIQKKKLDVPMTIDILLQTCSAIQAAHKKGIIHRDLKPENIFIVQRRNGPHVKVLDFGIAKFIEEAGASHDENRQRTGTGIILGTPGYMSFEQLIAKPMDHRTDVHALGVILHEMISGTPAFPPDGPAAVAFAIRGGKRNPLSDPALEKIVARATHWNREKRTKDVATFAKQLEEYAQTIVIVQEPRRPSILPVSINTPTIDSSVPPPPAPVGTQEIALFEEAKPPTPRALETHMGPVVTNVGKGKKRQRKPPLLAIGTVITSALLTLAGAVLVLVWHKPTTPTLIVVAHHRMPAPPSVVPTPIIPPPTSSPLVAIPVALSPPIPHAVPQVIVGINRNGPHVRPYPVQLATHPHCVDERYTYHDSQCCRRRSSGALDCDGEIQH